MMANVIKFALSNYSLTFLVVGLLTASLSMLFRQRSRRDGSVLDIFLSHYLLFALGLMFLYNFIMHVFFGEMCARFIGWANSPFQYEVGYASLGFGVVALLAHRRGAAMRLAAIVGPTLFLWGAAVGHASQMLSAHNFSPGNAGVVFWTDILIPVFGLALYVFWRRADKVGR